MKLSMGLPDREEEIRILETYREKDPLLELNAVMTCEELIAVKRQAEKTYVHPLINGYPGGYCSCHQKAEKGGNGSKPQRNTGPDAVLQGAGLYGGKGLCDP